MEGSAFSGARPLTISTELLVSTALLFGAALLIGVVAGVLVLPYLESPAAAILFLILLLAADLAILFLFLRYLLRRLVLDPLDRVGAHAERIAGGDFEHRIPLSGREELDRMVNSVNTMAENLIRDQRLLAENVRSLEETNRELVGTTDELIRTARMASVGTLAAGIAHEIGNPLAALQSSLDVSRRRLERGGDVDEALESASEEARRIDAIIRSVLEFARPGDEALGDGDAGESSAWVGSVARDAVALLERRGALEGRQVTVVESEEVPEVPLRSQLVEQVVVNLVMNAVQADETGPVEVRIRGERGVEFGPAPRRDDDPPGIDYSHQRRMARLRGGEPAGALAAVDQGVVIEVADRGPGIPEGDLPRLFDPFFTTRDPGKGTGMGLAITARIVHELGGRIEAENRTGAGALFRVRLPVEGTGGESEERDG
jgi:two-component system, NtrC family, sensor kinase